ncbi:MAG: peptidoglycan-binding domain-containing protein [Pseudomonadota bacterium]
MLIAPSAAAVRRIQAELAVGGYNPGPIDGALGPRTERALRGFQRDRGFIEGLVTVETLSALGIAVAHSSSGQAAGPQLAGARAAPTRRVVRRVAAQEAVQPAEPPDLPARLPNYISASTRHGVDALEWAGKTPR